MKTHSLLSFLLISTQIYAQCTLEECGPPPMMPNYLCSDGVTVAGPGDCIQNDEGQCYWEIIYCPSAYTGYLRSIDASFCMDACSHYYLESEMEDHLTNVTDLDYIESLSYFNQRYVDIFGEDVWCVECGAVDVSEITISGACEYPVDCFQDPCIEASCPAYPNAECVSTYCGGCYADFYNTNGELITNCGDGTSCPGDNPAGCFQNGCPDGYECVDDWENSCVSSNCSCDGFTGQWVCTDDCNGGTCFEIVEECTDLTGIFFGWCDMVLGVGFTDGSCQYISGCGWEADGVDYSAAFFETMDECNAACGGGDITCDEIYVEYDSLHSGEYIKCDYDNDCIAVWGHCDVGLGGCHYSVNEENYPGEEIDTLVELWIEGACMQWVCDCSAMPYAQCIDGICTSAYCMSDNPAGCFQTGCDEGYECIVDPNECVPSWCGCDGFYGEWFCTEDCGGGTCAEAGLLGDLNSDGQIDVVDIVAAVNLILSGQYDAMGDLNGDGMLNVVDIIMIVNIVLNS